MEKLDKVIAALEGKYGDMRSPSYGYPKPYGVFHYDAVCEDALELLKGYRDLLNKRCENCGNYECKNGRFCCNHECIDWDFDPGDTWLDVNGEDCCSYWKPREKE